VVPLQQRRLPDRRHKRSLRSVRSCCFDRTKVFRSSPSASCRSSAGSEGTSLITPTLSRTLQDGRVSSGRGSSVFRPASREECEEEEGRRLKAENRRQNQHQSYARRKKRSLLALSADRYAESNPAKVRRLSRTIVEAGGSLRARSRRSNPEFLARLGAELTHDGHNLWTNRK
jgi:hypothetical protein